MTNDATTCALRRDGTRAPHVGEERRGTVVASLVISWRR